MASENFWEVQSPARETKIIGFNFKPNGSVPSGSAGSTTLAFTGTISRVQRTAAGLFRVELTSIYPTIVTAHANLQMSGNSHNVTVNPKAVGTTSSIAPGGLVSSQKTWLEFQVLSGGVAFDPPAAATTQVNVIVYTYNRVV